MAGEFLTTFLPELSQSAAKGGAGYLQGQVEGQHLKYQLQRQAMLDALRQMQVMGGLTVQGQRLGVEQDKLKLLQEKSEQPQYRTSGGQVFQLPSPHTPSTQAIPITPPRPLKGVTDVAGVTPLTKEGEEDAAMVLTLTGKYPPGFGKYSVDQKNRLINKRALITRGLGLTPAEMATLPRNNEAKMKAVDRLTSWGAMVDVGMDKLTQHLDIAIDYAKRLPLGQLKTLNAAIQAGQREFNDPIANGYAAQILLVQFEYGRITSGPLSNAMLPVEFMKAGASLLSPGSNVESLSEIKTVLTRDAKIASGAVKKQQAELLGTVRSFGKDVGAMPEPSAPTGGPPVGTMKGGYRFKGGDPSKQENWVKQ